MKKAFLFLPILLLTLFLVGCDLSFGGGNGNNDNKTEENGGQDDFQNGFKIDGVGDLDVNLLENRISFSVKDDIYSFSINSIHTSFPLDGIAIIEINNEPANTTNVSLYEGKNSFKLKITSKGIDTVYELIITKLRPGEEMGTTVTSIELVDIQSEYMLDEAFSGSLLIKYSNYKEEKIKIDPSWVLGFDSSTPGEKSCTITYMDKKLEFKYKVTREVNGVYIKNSKALKVLENGDIYATLYHRVGFIDINSIEVKDAISLRILKTNDTPIEAEALLKDGINEFKLEITKIVDGKGESKVVNLTITRLYYADLEYGVSSIDTANVEKSYLLNSEPRGTLKVNLTNGKSIDVPVKDTIVEFDTSTSGTFTGKLQYLDCTQTFEYKVTDFINNIRIEGVEDLEINGDTISFSVDYYTDRLSINNVHYELDYKEIYFLNQKELKDDFMPIFDEGESYMKLVIERASGNLIYNICAHRRPEPTHDDSEIESISIGKVQTSYYLGDKFEGALVVFYKDNHYKQYEQKDFEVVGFDTSSEGTRDGSIKFKGREIKFTYTVTKLERQIVKILFPTKEYLQYSEFEDITVTIFFNDNSFIETVLTKENAVKFDTTNEGKQYMTFIYDGLEYFDVFYILPLKAISMELVDPKVEFYQHEASSTVFKAIVTFENDLVLEKDINTFIDTSVLGDQEITIKFQDLEVKHTINVHIPRIKNILKIMDNYKYHLNQEFIKTYLVVKYEDSKGADTSLYVTKEMVTKFDTSSLGKTTVEFIKDDYKYTFDVEVVVPDIIMEDVKETYYQYCPEIFINDFHISFLIESQEYEVNMDLPISYLNGFDVENLGPHHVVFEYLGFKKEWDMNVIKDDRITSIYFKDNPMEARDYYVGDVFVDELVVITYQNQTTEEYLLTEDMLEGFDTSHTTDGYNPSATAIIKDYHFSFFYSVRKAPEPIYLTSVDLPLEYYKDEEFKHGKLELHYNNMTSKIISSTECTIKNFDTSAYGEFDVILEYMGFKCYIRIKVIGEMNGIRFADSLFFINYKVGEAYRDDISYEILYADGRKDFLTAKLEDIIGFDTSKPGNITISMSMNGFTCTGILKVY